LIAAGHEADGAYWIDDLTGQWCSTTYFDHMPWWLQRINDQRNQVDDRDNLSWEPLFPLSYYLYLPYQSSPTLFQYWISQFGKNKFRAYKETPMANSEVCRIGLEALEKEQLGKDEYPDFLILNFQAGGHLDETGALSAVEVQDIYFRLDQEIATLLKAVDQQVGLDQTLIYVIGAGSPSSTSFTFDKKRSDQGEFYPDRCLSLLNLYLMALYGEQKWVTGYANQQIYLDRALIDQKGINYTQFSATAAEFLSEFSGVQRVITARQLLADGDASFLHAYQNSYYPDRSGDLMLEIKPGWIIRHNGQAKDYQVRYDPYITNLIIYGYQIQPQIVDRPVFAKDLAVTLSKVIRTRAPNAAAGLPLPEIKP
jgi:hypothetical protein